MALAFAFVLPHLPERIRNVGSGVLRIQIWESAFKMLGDRPLTGVGIDQFLNQFRLEEAPGQYKYLPRGFEESFTSHPHNIFLDYWLSLGIMGVLVLIWLLWRYFRVALARTKGAALEGDHTLRALGIGLLASMTVFLVHGQVDGSYFLMDLAMIFWLSCGMLQVARKRNADT
jgi:O-antigen ligase